MARALVGHDGSARGVSVDSHGSGALVVLFMVAASLSIFSLVIFVCGKSKKRKNNNPVSTNYRSEETPYASRKAPPLPSADHTDHHLARVRLGTSVAASVADTFTADGGGGGGGEGGSGADCGGSGAGGKGGGAESGGGGHVGHGGGGHSGGGGDHGSGGHSGYGGGGGGGYSSGGGGGYSGGGGDSGGGGFDSGGGGGGW